MPRRISHYCLLQQSAFTISKSEVVCGTLTTVYSNYRKCAIETMTKDENKEGKEEIKRNDVHSSRHMLVIFPMSTSAAIDGNP